MQQMKSWKLWIVFIAIFLVSLNLRPAVTSIGPLLSTIGEDLGVSSTKMSLLTSIPVFCMGLFAPLAVPFQKKFGYRAAINGLVLCIASATFARILFDSYMGLIMTSFIAGFSIAIISPMINAFIKEKFGDKMAPVIGLYSFAMGAGATISAGLTGVFYKIFDNNWPIALSIWGVLAIVAIIVWTIAAAKKEPITAEHVVEDEARNPWKTKSAWLILIYFGLQTSLFFSLTTWLSSMAMEQGMTLLTAGSVLTTMSIVQLMGNIAIPMLVGKYPNRISWLFGLITLGLVGALVLFIDTSWSIWLGAMILGAALSGLFPIGLMLPLDEARNNREANEWSSMVLSGGFMMSAILPLVIGVVFDATGTHAYTKVIFVGLFILMFISIFVMQQQKRRV
ncbi:MFS transporter [Solibacillus sp. FSL H8-0538]|uniref:MFS transporter n=1 Tax=Solibacillus sp. FSL H8-0538 TaxID=2921400 RepID=UPI0030FC3508